MKSNVSHAEVVIYITRDMSKIINKVRYLSITWMLQNVIVNVLVAKVISFQTPKCHTLQQFNLQNTTLLKFKHYLGGFYYYRVSQAISGVVKTIVNLGKD